MTYQLYFIAIITMILSAISACGSIAYLISIAGGRGTRARNAERRPMARARVAYPDFRRRAN